MPAHGPSDRPHPGSLPQGVGELFSASSSCGRARLACGSGRESHTAVTPREALKFTGNVPNGSPSPRGEGWGEGELPSSSTHNFRLQTRGSSKE
jgi:hypothetical protein